MKHGFFRLVFLGLAFPPVRVQSVFHPWPDPVTPPCGYGGALARPEDGVAMFFAVHHDHQEQRTVAAGAAGAGNAPRAAIGHDLDDCRRMEFSSQANGLKLPWTGIFNHRTAFQRNSVPLATPRRENSRRPKTGASQPSSLYCIAIPLPRRPPWREIRWNYSILMLNSQFPPTMGLTGVRRNCHRPGRGLFYGDYV